MNVELNRFIACSNCHRSFSSLSDLWHDKEKRICVCCNCIDCKDTSIRSACANVICYLHSHIDDDFITYISKPEEAAPKERRKDELEARSDAKELDSNICYLCDKELHDYVFCNLKFTEIDEKGDNLQNTKRIKFKVCLKCYNSDMFQRLFKRPAIL